MLFCIQGTNLDSRTLKNVKPSFDELPIILFLNISIPVISEASDMFSRNVASGRQEPILNLSSRSCNEVRHPQPNKETEKIPTHRDSNSCYRRLVGCKASTH